MDSQFREPIHVQESPPQATEAHQEVVERKLISHFRVEQLLGTGGMSVVYKCTDMAVHRTVAVKILQPRLAAEEKWLMRFQQEAKAIGRLSHPNIVRVHHFDVHTDEPFIVMDYVEGIALSHLLASHGALGIPRSIKIMSAVMDALAHAHANQVIHRDLKPSNIMVVNPDTADENIKILDFGIAKITEEELSYKLTQTGEIFGSPLYMSPEQCQGKVSDDRSDQYSVGCVLYECLTGYPPFTGDNSMSILIKHLNDTPASLKEGSLGHVFPTHLENVVHRLLEKDPQRRFNSMAEAKLLLDNPDGKSSPVTADQIALAQIKSSVERRSLIVCLTMLSGIAVVALVLLWFVTMLGPTTSFGPQVKQERLLQEVDKDYGDDAIGEYLVKDDHRFAASFDTGEHNFKIMTDKGLTEIAKMPNLSALTLTNCGNITPSGLESLIRVPKLEHLDLKGTSVGDNSIPVIVKIKSLLFLNLQETSVHEPGLRELSGSQLKVLNVRSTNVDDGCCKAISTIKSLQTLNLSGNRRVPEGLKYIVTLPHLDNLDLGNTTVGDKELPLLSHLK